MPELQISLDEIEMLSVLLGYFLDYLNPETSLEAQLTLEQYRHRQVAIVLLEKLVVVGASAEAVPYAA